MKISTKAVVLFVLVVVLAAAVVPALAQNTTTTVTVTETQFNETYRVTNPPRRSVSNVVVDLQPDQAVVSATLTERNKTALAVVVTLVPTVSNGRITWSATAATASGEAISGDLLTQINNSIAASWRNYVKGKSKPGRVVSVEITDDDLTITYNKTR